MHIVSMSLTLRTGVEEKLLVPHDEHVLASLLKTFYRELPEPLIADTFFDNLTTAAQDGRLLAFSFPRRIEPMVFDRV